MNLAKISLNGQITIPIEVRRALLLEAGDKVLFINKPTGEIVIENASMDTIRKAYEMQESAGMGEMPEPAESKPARQGKRKSEEEATEIKWKRYEAPKK